MTIYSRSAWGAQLPRRPLVPAGTPGDSLVVHHVGSGASAPTTHAGVCAALRTIQQVHFSSPEGYADIAYNMAVSQAGDIYELRGMTNLGAATFGANDHTRAVLWVGDSTRTPPSQAALQAVADLYWIETGSNLTADATVTGHRDWVATACPGDPLYALIPTIRTLAKTPPAPVTPPALEEDTPMFICWNAPDGTLWLLNTATGAAQTVNAAFPTAAGWPAYEQALKQLAAAGLLRTHAGGALFVPLGRDAHDMVRSAGRWPTT